MTCPVPTLIVLSFFVSALSKRTLGRSRTTGGGTVFAPPSCHLLLCRTLAVSFPPLPHILILQRDAIPMPTRGGGTVFAPPKRAQARPPPADHTLNINIRGAWGANEAAATCPSQARSSTRGGTKTVPPPVGDSADRASHHGVYPQPAVTNVTRAGVAGRRGACERRSCLSRPGRPETGFPILHRRLGDVPFLTRGSDENHDFGRPAAQVLTNGAPA